MLNHFLFYLTANVKQPLYHQYHPGEPPVLRYMNPHMLGNVYNTDMGTMVVIVHELFSFSVLKLSHL